MIFLTFKDAKRDTWEETYAHIRRILAEEFERHGELLDSDACSTYEKRYFRAVLEEKADGTDLMCALKNLSKMLDEQYRVAPIIMIDEYDTPIRQGHMRGFYEEVILFMRNLFSGGLKDNRHLSYGFMTGILRVAQESMFSGLNNLKANSVLDSRYSEYFGFTAEEVREMVRYYHASDKYGEICTWYDGYRFGDCEIFNPWSVVNYFNNKCSPRAFWQATGSNEIIGEILESADETVCDRLRMLLQGETFLTHVDTEVIYPQIKNDPSSVYSFLLVAGYLKVLKSEVMFNGDFMCEVALPNREISFVYNKEILQKLEPVLPQSTAIAVQEALYANDAAALQRQLRKLLLHSASFLDTAGEMFYHGLVLGLCAVTDDRYRVTSNRESGEGRYDIQMLPGRETLPGIVIELKAADSASGEKLRQLAEEALEQIDRQKYETELSAQGVTWILKYGVAFCGKQVEVAESETRQAMPRSR